MWVTRKTSGADPSHSPAHQGSPIEVRDDNFWDRHCRELCRVLLFETSLVCHAAGIAALVPRCQLHLLYGENSLMRHGTGMPHRGPSALPHFPSVVRLTVGMTMGKKFHDRRDDGAFGEKAKRRPVRTPSYSNSYGTLLNMFLLHMLIVARLLSFRSRRGWRRLKAGGRSYGHRVRGRTCR